MRNKLFFVLIMVIGCTDVPGQEQPLGIPFTIQGRTDMIVGISTNGLLPVVLCDMPDGNLRLSIEFITESNFVGNNWLKITNQVGSKVRLWGTNGTEVALTNSSALAAWKLPMETTVSNVMHVIPYRRRGEQWWSPAGPGSGQEFYAYGFVLKPLFGIAFTNDVIVELRPLMYKASTNKQNVHLVEFSPIRIKVKPNGNIEKVK